MKLAIAAGVLAGLAACTTVPQSASPPIFSTVHSPSILSTTQTLVLPVSPVFAATLPEVPVSEAFIGPASEVPRPALLTGGFAREYQRGGASWYGPGFHGKRTASGERYDMNAMTAAHRTLPFGTWVRIRSLVNGREVDVRITDRGPFIRTRVIDISRSAAEALGMLGLGFKQVVLLMPDSTPDVVDLPLTKGQQVVRSNSRVR